LITVYRVFLTRQFYELNYNLQQRLDILQVLTDAAVQLSSPKKDQSKIELIDNNDKFIIKEHVASEKTRRWGHQKKPQEKPQQNNL